jgi:hypothetical protein
MRDSNDGKKPTANKKKGISGLNAITCNNLRVLLNCSAVPSELKKPVLAVLREEPALYKKVFGGNR